MVMSMFALGHETVHRTAFESAWVNELVCWLACLPIYYVPEIFRQFHFAHHRHTHHPGLDPEISMGGEPIPSVTSNLPLYVLWLSGLPVLFYKVAVMLGGSIGHGRFVWQFLMPYVKQRSRKRVRWESRVALCIHLGYLYAAWQWLPGLWNLLWAQWLGHAMLAIYLTTEHNGLPHTGSAIERTRTMLTNRAIKFLMWNMPYHAEHHAYPAVPWHALPKLHELIQDELRHTDSSYVQFHSRVLSQVYHGQAFLDPGDRFTP
jgi:fatty acid desaturase